MELRQLILLAVSVTVPALLIATRRETLLVRWICVVVGISIFDSQIGVNLPAARVAGLLLLPMAVTGLANLLRTRSGKVLLLHFAYLVLLGVIFGYVVPWPSAGFQRTVTQSAAGRSLVHLLRTAADLSLAIYISRYVARTGRPDQVVRYVLAGTALAACGGVLEYLTRIDVYYLVTGSRPLALEYRMRGFNYEPRGLGLMATHGLVFSLMLYSHRRSWRQLGSILLHAAALFLTIATSALAALTAGISALFFVDKQTRKPILVVAAIGLLLLASLARWEAGEVWLQTWTEHMEVRLASASATSASASWAENIAARTDVFDASAILFLVDNPLYLLVGTGPGLVTLPATDYVPHGMRTEWVWQERAGLNTPPQIGLVRELSNSGLVGLVLLGLFGLFSWRAFQALRLVEGGQFGPWGTGGVVFLAAAAVYLVQASPLSAIWPVFMGLGLAADQLASREWGASGIASQLAVRQAARTHA